MRKTNRNSQKTQKDADAAKIKAEAEQKRLAEKEAVEAKRKEEIKQKRQQAENARREAEQMRRQIEEKRKAEAAASAEARKQAAEQRKAEAASAAQAKRKNAEEKRKTQAQEKQVKQALGGAKKGATVSLGFFNFGQKSEEEGEAEKIAATTTTGAPRGVPTLSKWSQNGDGSITGEISGSKSYDDGETVTTSGIAGEVTEGSVVQTRSGSRYVGFVFLCIYLSSFLLSFPQQCTVCF